MTNQEISGLRAAYKAIQRILTSCEEPEVVDAWEWMGTTFRVVKRNGHYDIAVWSDQENKWNILSDTYLRIAAQRIAEHVEKSLVRRIAALETRA